MYSQEGGSLDVVCSSERKKSGSTLRPQHGALSVKNLLRKSGNVTATVGRPSACSNRRCLRCETMKFVYMHAVHTAAFTAPLASLAAVWLRSDRLRDQIGSDHIGWLSWLAELAGLVNFLGANGIPSVGREPIVESLERRGGVAGLAGLAGLAQIGLAQISLAQISLAQISLAQIGNFRL